MTEPIWLTFEDAKELQVIVTEKDAALAGGLIKPDLPASALARAQNEYFYAGITDLFELAATYAVSIANNHPFADANKRTAFLAADVFLYENGFELQAAIGTEHADMMVRLTDKQISRKDAAHHLRTHCKAR